MPHDRIFVRDFHGLAFADVPGLKLSKRALPDADFYANLYDRVEPSARFFSSKRLLGQLIGQLVEAEVGPGSLLSWGAGTGTVEFELAKRGWNVDAVEPGDSPAWPPEVRRYDELSEVPNGGYDAVICVSVLYSQPDAECRAILRDLADRLRPGGVMLIAEQDTRSVLGSLRGLIGRVVRVASRVQLWGFLRGPSYFTKHVPLQLIRSEYYALNDDWSYRAIPAPLRLFDRQLFARRSRTQLHIFRK